MRHVISTDLVLHEQLALVAWVELLGLDEEPAVCEDAVGVVIYSGLV